MKENTITNLAKKIHGSTQADRRNGKTADRGSGKTAIWCKELATNELSL